MPFTWTREDVLTDILLAMRKNREQREARAKRKRERKEAKVIHSQGGNP